MTFPQFKDEDEFCQEWISPFLSKLGYTVIAYSHGADEQGKDFFFADFDRFGHIRLYAIQAKNGDIGAGDTELDKLLNQVKRAFRIPIRYRKESEERRVSAVYIFASGKISDRAREYISDYCRSEPFGENVHYLDADRLERLERYALYLADQEIRTVLRGLYAEAYFNLQSLKTLTHDFQAHADKPTIHPRRCRNTALGQFLASPLPPEVLEVDFDFMDKLWCANEELNRRLNEWSQAMIFTQGVFSNVRQHALGLISNAREANTELHDKTLAAIHNLDKKCQADVEILSQDMS